MLRENQRLVYILVMSKQTDRQYHHHLLLIFRLNHFVSYFGYLHIIYLILVVHKQLYLFVYHQVQLEFDSQENQSVMVQLLDFQHNIHQYLVYLGQESYQVQL